MQYFEALTSWLWGTPLLVIIIACGLIFSIRSKFFQIAHLGLIIRNPFKKDPELKDSKNSLTPFQAVSIAVGGSVGVSNISGVGTAIATGGPGALFWLWIAALIGMIIKMAEVSLAVYYRRTNPDGTYTGGPTYYMERGLGEQRGWKGWKILAILFGFGIFMNLFISIQNYTVSEAIGSTFGISYLIPGTLLFIGVLAISMGGVKKVGQIASYLVPFMCVFYIVCVIIVLVMNASAIPGAFGMIFESAFTGKAAVGGFAGATVAAAMQKGFARSVYSNEAGWGTSPMVHATANTNHPIKQGLLGAFEVFMDTIVVCSATGLLVIITGYWDRGLQGATLTLTALEANVGFIARMIVAICIYLFALTTGTGWCTYYQCVLGHMIGDSKAKPFLLKLCAFLNPLCGFICTLVTVIAGGTPAEIWVFADFTTIIPTFVNVAVLLILGGKFIELLKDYKARYLGIGQVDPNFSLFYEDEMKEKTQK